MNDVKDSKKPASKASRKIAEFLSWVLAVCLALLMLAGTAWLVMRILGVR